MTGRLTVIVTSIIIDPVYIIMIPRIFLDILKIHFYDYRRGPGGGPMRPRDGRDDRRRPY